MTISDVVVGNLTTLYLVVIAAMKAYSLATGRSFSSACVLVLSTLVVAAILIATLTYDVSRKSADAFMTRDHGHEMCRGGICWHGVAVKSPAAQMAEALPDPEQSPTPNQLPSGSNSTMPQYWCYQCNKRVSIETLSDLPDVVCYDCKNGFVESISASPVSDDPISGNPLVQVLHLIAQTALEDNAPPPPPPEPSEEDYLRIELDGWDDDDDDDEDDYDEQSVEVIHEDEVENRDHYPENGSNDAENDLAEPRGEDHDDEILRRRRELLRLRLRDFATRAANRRNRILDWAEILMGLEEHPFDLRLHVPESETYVGNPGDYVDAAGYEALLQNLADTDTGGRRGAPPAAKWVVERLESVLIQKEQEKMMCSICKDYVNAGESAKKLPCGHLYHGECINTWLASRNSCPICRFELPTDDTEYEEESKKRVVAAGLRTVSSSSSGSGGSRPNATFD